MCITYYMLHLIDKFNHLTTIISQIYTGGKRVTRLHGIWYGWARARYKKNVLLDFSGLFFIFIDEYLFDRYTEVPGQPERKVQ